MKTICIDARFYGVGDTGIGRYTQNLLANLPTDPGIKVVTISKTRFHPYSIWSQFEMLWLLLKIRPNLLHIPHDAPPLLWFGPIIITIHDLIKLESTGLATTTLPPWLYHFKNLSYRLLLSLSLMKAVHIITPSSYWKNILVRDYHISASKIGVIYEGVDAIFFS